MTSEQKPVAWLHPEAGWTDVSRSKVFQHCKHGTEPRPLYTAPVASDAELRAENERYKHALETIENPIKHFQKNAEAEGCTLNGGMTYALSNDADYLKGVARAALNPSETRA